MELEMERETPLVTVVIPAYNVEHYVGDALQSVQEQTYPNIEIICVDDGSTDGTLRVLQERSARASMPFQVVSTENQGAQAARNEGLARASGELLQFLDSDDLLLPSKIENQVGHMIGKPTDIVCGSYTYLRRDGAQEPRAVDPSHTPCDALLLARAGITSSILWRRSLLTRVGGWTPGLQQSHETDLLFRSIRAGARVVLLDEPATVVRQRPGSLTQSDHVGVLAAWLTLRVHVVDELRRGGYVMTDSVGHKLFSKVKSLYRYDRSQALKHHAVLFGRRAPEEFLPRSAWYRRVYRSLGFGVASALHNVYGSLRQGLQDG